MQEWQEPMAQLKMRCWSFQPSGCVFKFDTPTYQVKLYMAPWRWRDVKEWIVEIIHGPIASMVRISENGHTPPPPPLYKTLGSSCMFPRAGFLIYFPVEPIISTQNGNISLEFFIIFQGNMIHLLVTFAPNYIISVGVNKAHVHYIFRCFSGWRYAWK